jgi:fructose-1,6-bisphosphatase I
MSKEAHRLITLEEFIIRGQNRFRGASGELSQLLRDIGLAAKIISREINKAGINHILGNHGSENVHGEHVKKLDVFANEQMYSALSRSGNVSVIVSEESKDPVYLKSSSGKYIVFTDPLDGSSNIDVNISVGTIFSIYRRVSEVADVPASDDVLQYGLSQTAAGYVIYGSSTMLVYTTGLGVSTFTLDPSIGEFFLAQDELMLPALGTSYSVNEGSFHSWGEGLKQYVRYCQQEDVASQRPYSARYVGSMVADVHRILHKGGIFMYPSSKAYPEGKLRLMYECNPMAFIIEQAGGLAIDGQRRIMEISPSDIHQRSPIFIGSKQNIELLQRYMADHLLDRPS